MIIKIDKIETIKAIDKELNIITLFSLKKLMILSKVYVSGYTFGKYQSLPIPQKKELIIQQHKRGDFNANYSKFDIVFHNLPFEINSVQIDNVEIDLEEVQLGKNQSITLNKEFTELHLFGK